MQHDLEYEKCVLNCSWKTLRKEDTRGIRGVARMIILKWILKRGWGLDSAG
jgi:hypothetical protein